MSYRDAVHARVKATYMQERGIRAEVDLTPADEIEIDNLASADSEW